MKIDVYDAHGQKKSSVELSKDMFDAKINIDLMHRAVVLRLANKRTRVAHVKTRAEVCATKKKMYAQKGTGRARHGARSAGILRGGGVIHGPEANAMYSKMMPQRERRQALFSSLTCKKKEGGIFGLEGFASDTPKTKSFATLMSHLPQGKKTLFVLPKKDLVFEKSAANLPSAQTILVDYLNPHDVLLSEKLCFVGTALERLEHIFLPKQK